MAAVPFSGEWHARTDPTIDPDDLGGAGPFRPQVEWAHGGSGWVALVGSLLIVAAAIAVSVLVWSELPARLARPVSAGATRPELAATPAPTPAPAPGPQLVPVRTDALARSVARAAAFAAPAPLVPAVMAVTSVAPAASTPAAPASPVTASPAAPASSNPVPPNVEREASPNTKASGGRAAVDEVLDTYRRAFNALDAPAIVALWPGADADALSRSFSTLRYQNLAFTGCEVRQPERDRALATCVASISDVDKSDPAMRHRRERWEIALRRAADRWTIERVTMR
jgi:hypothetical protein